jgi:class 3 adenylate cyclase
MQDQMIDTTHTKHGEGGPMSVLFSATWPERTTALLLCGTFASGRALPASTMARLDDAIIHWGTGRTLPLFAPSVTTNLVHRQAVGLFERAALSPATARDLLEAIREVDVTNVLPTIRVPTLVVHRRDDVFVPAAHARDLASRIPEARYVELSGADHVPWIGDEDSVLDEVERFLTGARHNHSHARVLATVLFTDIVSSTDHAAALGDEAWRDLLERHNTVVRQVLDTYGGREIKTMGDGFLAAFDGPARAVRCAQSIIDAVRPLGIEVRGGVHTGECEVFEDGDVGGMAVHIGARVAAAAGPGELLVSRTVKDLVVGSGLQFVDRGVHTLKGVPGQWQLFALAEVAARTVAVTGTPPQGLAYTDRTLVGLARRAPGIVRAFSRLTGRAG